MLETRIDLGIHVEGWKEKEIAAFLTRLGYSSDYASDLFNQLIEMPSTYNAYGYGKYYFMKLHDTARTILGKYYNEVEFNSVILSHGWCSLSELQRITDEYIEETLHVCTVVEG